MCWINSKMKTNFCFQQIQKIRNTFYWVSGSTRYEQVFLMEIQIAKSGTRDMENKRMLNPCAKKWLSCFDCSFQLRWKENRICSEKKMVFFVSLMINARGQLTNVSQFFFQKLFLNLPRRLKKQKVCFSGPRDFQSKARQIVGKKVMVKVLQNWNNKKDNNRCKSIRIVCMCVRSQVNPSVLIGKVVKTF
jgi:hypothetical protein